MAWARSPAVRADSDVLTVSRPYNTAPILQFTVPKGSLLDPSTRVTRSTQIWVQTLLVALSVPSGHKQQLIDIAAAAAVAAEKEVCAQCVYAGVCGPSTTVR